MGLFGCSSPNTKTLHRDRQAFPWDPSQGTPGDRLHRDRQAFPWDPSQGTPGDRLHREDKPSPGSEKEVPIQAVLQQQ